MSTYAIKTFHTDLERLKHFGGTNKETAIRYAFQKLLDEYARGKDLLLIPEVSLRTKNGKMVTPDGTLKDVLRLDHGYWESKDEADDIDEEIQKKFAKGYPNDNIIFEDSSTAVLIQHGEAVMRTAMEDEVALDKMLTRFVSFERPEINDFRKAIEKFKEDIPKVTEAIREIIDREMGSPPGTDSITQSLEFSMAFRYFHELCKQSINPEITEEDIKEMMIQHIISADIFNKIFDDPDYHRENNIAKQLNRVVETFFTGPLRKKTLASIAHYYDTINAAAAGIADHHEKQMFLKVVYENFYKAYNPKAADRLGIVYTPNEIVQFMIKSTDYLLHKHFGKTLADKNVEILDPATGTGTFICDIIDFLPKNKLAYKYKHEMHANELAILPYYIANLNIEYTYKQKMGEYAEFENLCLVDTLDNTGFHWVGKQGDLFGVSAENAQRIRKQNEKKISVVIGNPPYNVGQMNENDNNKNRNYPEIDKRIKDTYIKKSTARKTKVYDMYSRFFRWASDRIQDDGIISFITNNSYINARTFDGFRKSIQDEFQFAYFIDLGGNITELSGRDGIFLNEKHTIFGQAAAVGIAIGVLIKDKRRKLQPCHINYTHPCDIRATRDEKIAFIQSHKFEDISFTNITPDVKNNWINIAENDWDDLIPIASKKEKGARKGDAIFNLSANGVATGRDEWNYDISPINLEKKATFFINTFNNNLLENTLIHDLSIKWSETLKNYFKKQQKLVFNSSKIVSSDYRPFYKCHYYSEKILSDRLTENHYSLHGKNLDKQNIIISFTGPSSQKPFLCLITNSVTDWHYAGPACGTICIPYHFFDKAGDKIENITDWGHQKFTDHYANKKITKEDIFHYCYAVLHNPTYRKKYELNLKREFPRIPFYNDFWQWVEWGKQLMELHIEYEKASPYPLKRIETTYELTSVEAHEKLLKGKLKADKVNGTIELDGFTTLRDVPKIAWEYKLGNRSALEWILDQYKENKPKDPTIAEKFNTYRFAEYKEQVIDLLMRVCTVSVETMKIMNSMPQ